jgi:uncharacterized protein
MQNFIHEILSNAIQAPILFFLMGLIAVSIKSDLRIPTEVSKFLSLYLLFNIGIRGGQELFEQGLNLAAFEIISICIIFAFFSPFIFFYILRMRLDVYNSGAIAATYGSVSLVTFATAIAYLNNLKLSYGGYMVAGMAFMELVAIVAGLLLIRINTNQKKEDSLFSIFRDSFASGSVYLLLGSFFIGFITAEQGKVQLEPFIYDIFKGILCLYMLDMGLYTANKIKQSSVSMKFLSVLSIIFPLTSASLSILISYIFKLDTGDAFLFCVLCASSSYIAVPAAMRMSVPQANIGIIIPMTLGITFPFNIVIGIPVYFFIIERLWS